MTVGVHSVTREHVGRIRPRSNAVHAGCHRRSNAAGLCHGLVQAETDRRTSQKARVKPPLDPAKREFTTLLKIDPNE